jgi:hypothetical protein
MLQWIFKVDKSILLWKKMPPPHFHLQGGDSMSRFPLMEQLTLFFTKYNLSKPSLYLEKYVNFL